MEAAVLPSKSLSKLPETSKHCVASTAIFPETTLALWPLFCPRNLSRNCLKPANTVLLVLRSFRKPHWLSNRRPCSMWAIRWLCSILARALDVMQGYTTGCHRSGGFLFHYYKCIMKGSLKFCGRVCGRVLPYG